MRSLASVGEVEREASLVGGNCIRAGRYGQAGEVHGILLGGTKELEDDYGKQVGSGQFLSRAVGGEIASAGPFPNRCREERSLKGARGKGTQ